ncbi:NKAP domain containing 1 isoform X1 [Tachysurus fulvidraco]|uniref:NKAP domain containing 1 isoform X1 n=2 Tax=Tachysurus fulvidraco TaxID=1234273 RepID=UPI000F4FDD12|nr:NKAP domain containing 1 isoform X1 [Tachysurus fulvidraco]
MAKVPMGKVLLRNVIRHTDAHNKIQEESEMWKLRDMELHTPSPRESKNSWNTRSSMHCDRYLKESEGSARGRLGDKECLSERDEREARYWTRKLYEFEANDPDRWGHSGFKELYPEEFQQSHRETDDVKHRRNGKDKLSTEKQKKTKKSSKRKKKKKKKKQRTEGSDSESDSSPTEGAKRKLKRKSGKSKHRRKKAHKHKTTEEDRSTDDSESDRAGERTHRKRRQTIIDTQAEPERKKRKNWKAANEEKSEESSDN